MVEFRYQRLKELREAHNMTLDDMGAKLGKQKQQVGIWENGINSPTIDNLLLICNTLDVHPSFFFDEVSSSVEETKAA